MSTRTYHDNVEYAIDTDKLGNDTIDAFDLTRTMNDGK